MRGSTSEELPLPSWMAKLLAREQSEGRQMVWYRYQSKSHVTTQIQEDQKEGGGERYQAGTPSITLTC